MAIVRAVRTNPIPIQYRAIYLFPNDASELERLDYQYMVLAHAFDQKLHFAPLSNPQSILDIGTGTGIWATEMGDQYPAAQIEATDLSPIQPSSVPENVQFLIDDAEQDDWCAPSDHYDYIHTRMMLGSFQDFRTIIAKAFHHTRPGGWMESQDLMPTVYCDDGTMPDTWPLLDWAHNMDAASMREPARPLRIANRLKKWYLQAGFVDVQERIIRLPINDWPKDPDLKLRGMYWAENLMQGLSGLSLAYFSRVLMWSPEEIQVYLVSVRKAITDRRVHAYQNFYVVWGRKPRADEAAEPDTAALYAPTIASSAASAVMSFDPPLPRASPTDTPAALATCRAVSGPPAEDVEIGAAKRVRM
ncbi:MAG: hypothetical protein M1818_002711 [Claussenomyces sp. TS43310]|nr:MAG: hypothetical protein M1818_002711 [Claussenomyces sp. TS43310]